MNTAYRKKLSEPGRQFAQIFNEWNDPEERAKRKLLENRQKRAELNKLDKGL